MKALNKFTILGLLLILLSVGAKADFAAGEFDLQVECCQSVFTTYEFTNNYNQTLTYRLKSVGDGADWVNFNGKNLAEEELVFELGAGKTKELFAFINPCCYTKQGEYVLGIEYSSTKGTKTQKINVTVPECRTITIDAVPETSIVGQCETALVELKLSNQSIASEKLQLSIEGLEQEWFEFSPSEFLLSKDSDKTINLEFTAPCDAALKEYKGTAIVKIKDTEFVASDEFSIKVEDKQEIEIGTDAQVDSTACNDLDDKKTITITNNGREKDALTLSIEGPDWVDLKQKAVILEAGEAKDLTIEFLKGDIEEKNYLFTIKAESQLYGKETSKTFTVKIEDCFKLGFGKTSGPEEACIEEPLEFEFLVQNIKEKDSTIKVSIEGMPAELSDKEFELKSGKEKAITAKFDLSNETPGNKEFKVAVKGDNFEISKNYVIKLNDCYALELNAEDLALEHQIEIGTQICSQAKIITSTITNTGTKSQTISLEFEGENWIIMQPEEFELRPNETKEFYTYFNPAVNTEEGTYTGKLKVKAKSYLETIEVRTIIKAISVEMIDVTAESELEEEIIETSTTVKAKIHLKNSGNCALEVKNIKAEGYSVEFDSTQFTLDVNEEKVVVASVFLGENFEGEEISFPVTIETDRGLIGKVLNVNLSEEEVSIEETIEEQETETEGEAETEGEDTMPAGLATLGNTTVNMVILLFLAIVAVVIVILAYHTYNKPDNEKPKSKANNTKSTAKKPVKKTNSNATNKAKAIKKKLK